jgi:hypothetical protein
LHGSLAASRELYFTVHRLLIEMEAGSIFDACNQAAGDVEIVVEAHV